MEDYLSSWAYVLHGDIYKFTYGRPISSFLLFYLSKFTYGLLRKSHEPFDVACITITATE